MSRRERVRRALFPGERRVWLVAAGLGSLFLVAIAIALLVPRDHYTGTSSVRLRSFPIELAAGNRLCVPQRIPDGTGRAEMWVDTAAAPRPRIEPYVVVAGEGARPARVISPIATGPHKIAFDFPEVHAGGDAVPGQVCLLTHGKLFVGGMHERTAADPIPTVDGKQAPHRISMWFREPGGAKRSVASMLPDAVERAALFRPGIVGPWTYVLILVLGLPGLIYGALRLLARSEEDVRRRIPLAACVALVAFGHAACWALVNPALDAPDETEHFAYAQRLAETGDGLDPNIGRVYSSDEALAADALHTVAWSETGDGRPPWLEADEENWRDLSKPRPARDDGGAPAPSIESHSPVYYGTLAPAYKLTSGWSFFSQITVMRLFSALYGALAAACAFGIVRELLPRRRLVAVAAGLLVALQPMFAFMSSTVNNDMGVNGLSALLLYLVVRAYVRGVTPRLGAAIGTVLILAPLMKGTAYALYPAALVGLGGALWRHRDRRTLTGLAVAGAAAVALFVAWTLVSGHFDRQALTTPTGEAPGSGFSGTENPRGLAAYLWQIFLPPLGFMVDYWQTGAWPYFDIYVVRGWAAFGWYAMTFSDWVYWVIAFAMPVVAAGAVVALLRHRERLRELLVPAAVFVLAVVGVFGGVHAFYFPNTPRFYAIPEQGRYIFPTIAALATIAVASSYAFGRRWVVTIASALVVAMAGTALAAQLMALTRFYT